MDAILESAYTSTATVNAMADDVYLAVKQDLYGLKNIAQRDWMEIFYYFMLYQLIYIENARTAEDMLTDQEELDMKEEIYQAYIP